MMEALQEYRRIWERKPVLRAIYDDFYGRIAASCRVGLTIEIGGGIGNLKDRLNDVVSTDIQFAPWLDCVADAQRLPFADGAAANIVMVDVLHHIEFPIHFFREAERLLRTGGRIITVEPAITWGSTLFYRFLHHEPVNMDVDPLVEQNPDPNRDPYDSNQAIPTLIATQERQHFVHLFPSLRITRVDWFSLMVYPLSGGFKSWSLIPVAIARRLLGIERIIEPVLGPWMAFRMMLVIDKTETPELSNMSLSPADHQFRPASRAFLRCDRSHPSSTVRLQSD
jgi:SAM-dependent methyltransferase